MVCYTIDALTDIVATIANGFDGKVLESCMVEALKMIVQKSYHASINPLPHMPAP